MTARKVAGPLRVSKATVTRLARNGTLQTMPIPGGLLVVQDEVTPFMKHGPSNPPKPSELSDELPAA